jgi:hypothetical protein
MNNRYQIFDTEENDLYIGVISHYFKVSDAKEVYRKSVDKKEKDDSILIEIAKAGEKEVKAAVTFGVDEGEQFALALLNLCNSIKR